MRVVQAAYMGKVKNAYKILSAKLSPRKYMAQEQYQHFVDRYFFLTIYHKSLIQSKVTFLKKNPARRTN
jgi:hypothetical protein